MRIKHLRETGKYVLIESKENPTYGVLTAGKWMHGNEPNTKNYKSRKLLRVQTFSCAGWIKLWRSNIPHGDCS